MSADGTVKLIEDALKSTRNLHRLILAVSLVTLVFSFSLRVSESERLQKAVVDELIDTDFTRYSDWLEPKLDAAISEYLRPAVQPLDDSLRDDVLAFNFQHITDALIQPAHVGQILVDQLVLANMSAASLSALDALNGLSLERNVQISVPQLGEIEDELRVFFERNSGFGKRIDSVLVTINDFDYDTDSFHPGDTITTTLYFELRDAVAVAGSPVFQAYFESKLIELPNTSFLAWLRETNNVGAIAVRDNRLLFAPSLNDLPRGFREEALGSLSLRLANDIQRAGPEARSATILGTEVPGLLIVLAAPLTLMALTYYFVSHAAHIARVAEHRAEEIVGFAWLPLTMTDWRFRGIERRIPGYVVELVFSLVFLPVLSLATLFLKLYQFGGVSLATGVLIGLAIVWVIVFAWYARSAVLRIRNALANVQN